MKTKTPFRFWPMAKVALFAFSILVFGLVSSTAQQPVPAKKAPPSPATPGYLSKSAPMGLRFAPPPKPPVAYLPPLPITYDPQPVFTPEFASPNGELPQPIHTGSTSNQTAAAVPPSPEKVLSPLYPTNDGAVKQGQFPLTAGDVGIVSPQMLVKFFQQNQPGEVQMLINNPVSFRAPVREERPSSSASYQVK